MSALDECDEYPLQIGARQYLISTASTATIDHQRLADLAVQTSVPGDVSVFVASIDVSSPGIRRYLEHLRASGVDAVAVVFDPVTTALVHEGHHLIESQRQLGIPVHVPDPAALPGDAAHRHIPVTTDAQRTTPGQAAGHRLVSDSAAEQHRHWQRLIDAVTAQGPSPALLSALPRSAPGSDLAVHLAVPYALQGNLPGLSVAEELLSSLAPVTPATLEGALRGTFQRIEPAVLAGEFDHGNASAMLAHGWLADRSPAWFWLYRDPAGELRWLDPRPGAESVSPARLVTTVDGIPSLDGDESPLAALLEQADTTALLIDADNNAYTPKRQTPAAAEPAHVPAAGTTRLSDHTVLVGAWYQDGKYAANASSLEAYTGPATIIAVKVRHEILKDFDPVGNRYFSRKVLQRGLAERFTATLARTDTARIAFLTETAPELESLALSLGASVVSARAGADVGTFAVRAPGGSFEEVYQALGNGVWETAHAGATPPPVLPEPLRELVFAPTWPEAQLRYQQHAETFRDPMTLESLSAYRAAASDIAGRHDLPVRFEDRTITAFELLVRTGIDAPASSVAQPDATAAQQFPTDPVVPQEREPSVDFLFGYLTDRPLTAEAEAAGSLPAATIWLRALVGHVVGGTLTPDDLLTLMRAKGELDAERAHRQPGDREVLRGYASVIAALNELVSSADPPAVPTAAATTPLTAEWLTDRLREAGDCFTGQDRVVLLGLAKSYQAHWPERADTVQSILDWITDCH
ncbi:hypothetical protein [Mangrovihabitans endophyticus]|nr:hypothetical protein [Mangrovihabitans endophyticus]